MGFIKLLSNAYRARGIMSQFFGDTALGVAARKGHTEVVQ